jgi:hypothetical protein
VAAGPGLSYPALWINPSEVSETEDPYRYFGAYDIPVVWLNNLFLAKKLRLFWHYRDSVSVVGVGSSGLHYGFYPGNMSVPTVNLATYGSDITTAAVIARDYVLPHASGLAAVVIDLTVGSLDNDALDNPSLLHRLSGLYVSKGYGLDTANDFFRGGLPQEVADKCSAMTKDKDWPGLESNGYEETYAAFPGSGWGDPVIDKGDYSVADPVVQKNLALLRALGDSAAAKGVHCIIVHMPENPRYDTTGSIGRYGPARSTYTEVAVLLDSMTQQNAYMHFYDANDYGRHDFVDSEALDCNHLNYTGALRMAAKIDSVVHQYVP